MTGYRQPQCVIGDRLTRRQVGSAGFIPCRRVLWLGEVGEDDPEQRSPPFRLVYRPLEGPPRVLRAVDADHNAAVISSNVALAVYVHGYSLRNAQLFTRGSYRGVTIHVSARRV